MSERAPTSDELDGMQWWNLLSEQHRRHWMSRAGDTGRVADAWAVFKRDSVSGVDMNEKLNSGVEVLPPATPAPMMSNHPDPVVRAAFDAMCNERAKRQAERPTIDATGREALGRLFKVAQSDTGQARRVAAFLLGCYNGTRFPFDLTDFRGLDYGLFDDCLAVLRMDYQPRQEVHNYFENGGAKFEQLAKDWGLVDVERMRLELRTKSER